MVACCALMLSTGSLRAQATDRSFVFQGTADQARDYAAAEGKVFIVWVHAAWSPRSQQFEREILADERVRAWFENHAVVASIDVARSRSFIERFDIKALPALIVAPPGKPERRLRGIMDPALLVERLDGVLAAWMMRDLPTAEQASQAGSADRLDQESVVKRLENMVRSNAWRPALNLTLEAWPYMYDDRSPEGKQVRNRFARMLPMIAKRHPSGNRRITELRSKAFDAIKANPYDPIAVERWVHLDVVALRQGKGVLTWFDHVKNKPEARAAIGQVSTHLEKLLRERGTLQDLLVIQPEALARTGSPDMSDVPRSEREAVLGARLAEQRAHNASWYVALLLEKRFDQALVFSTRVSFADPQPLLQRGALAAAGIEAGFDSVIHQQWVAEAEELREQIRARLEEKRTADLAAAQE